MASHMVGNPSSKFREYIVALIAIGVATALVLSFHRIGYRGLSPFMAAVVVSAWYGGIGPGTVSLVLSSLLAYCLLPGHQSAGPDLSDLLRTAVFAVVASLAIALHFVTRHAREVAEDARDAAEEARVAAEEANAAKTKFLAMVSHELRNPLGPIVMAVAAIELDPCIGPSVKEELETIRRSVAVQVRLIEDLVDIARVVSGKLKFIVVLMDLHDPLRAAIRSCQDGIQDKRLQLKTEYDALRTSVYGDAGRLQQVFWNLLRNAIKFTPEDGWIAVKTYNDSSDCVTVEITDSGIGIEPNAMRRIFTPFEQGSDGVTTKFGGLGLGLSICGAVIEAHGGTLRATSEGPSKGATFAVSIPLRPDVQITDQAESETANSSF